MHTMSRDSDKTWCVGRMVDYATGTQFDVMFSKMSFDGALRLVNVLNGGTGQLGVMVTPSIWEMCANG